MYTTSLDRVCNVYGLHSPHPLLAVLAPSPLTVACVDALERMLFLGGADGVVYQCDLHAMASAKASPGAGDGDVELQAFRGHARAVTDVRVSPAGALLVSASEDGTAKVWDVTSRQALQSFDTHKGTLAAGSGVGVCRVCWRRRHCVPEACLLLVPLYRPLLLFLVLWMLVPSGC